MKKTINVMLAALMLASFAILNCARDDVAVVHIQLKNLPRSTAANSNSVFERVFRWFVPGAWAAWPYPNIDLQVVITAPDLYDISFNVPLEDSAVTIEVPAGPGRRITVYGYRDYTEYVEKNWGGHVELDLNPGDEVDAQIDMLPVLAPWTSEDGSVYVHWNPVSSQAPIYNVQGYHVYRSDAGPEGPYIPVGDVVFQQNYFIDEFADSGQPHYYKMSVFTGEREGELSDPCLFQPALIIGNIQ